MRARPFVAVAIVLGVAAQAALAQQRDGGMDAGTSPAPAAAPSPAPPVERAHAERSDVAVARPPPDAPQALPPAPRDDCAEVLRSVQFEDAAGASAAYARCRGRVAREGHVPTAEEVRTLEDVTDGLHGLRRDDGAFCVEPSAPFDFSALTAGAADTRACLLALDRFLASDNAVWRFVLADEYASGRLAARGSYDVASARRTRVRPGPDTPGERELVAIARLAGRHFMRTCRCLPGPQPDTVTSVRAMTLPSTVEGVILRALEDREGAHAEP